MKGTRRRGTGTYAFRISLPKYPHSSYEAAVAPSLSPVADSFGGQRSKEADPDSSRGDMMAGETN